MSALEQGQLLVIFPEGRITRDGQLQPFKSGILKIMHMAQERGLQPPIIPMALRGLWGSYFSWIELAGPMKQPFRRGWRNRVQLHIGQAMQLPPPELSALRAAVDGLLDGSVR